MEKNKKYEGFLLKNIYELPELNSKALIFEHEKTKAKLLKLENDDDNKVFCITFRTPPNDDTGLPHILEHSVLCGSKKFDTKEPFVELIKCSLNTFLNAMTFSDKTMYPVASKNEKDFFNLMDVYLDAVLNPNIQKDDLIMLQEGWHYELEKEEDDLIFKGVVYNEMKGAFSSPIRILWSEIEKSLYPETPYSFESGGQPDSIPELTLENFRRFHKKYYHPSNSYIFLYGNGDTLKELKFINENYLKHFDRLDIDSSIPDKLVVPSKKEKIVKFSISENEELNNKSFLSLSWSCGRSTDTKLYFSLKILEHILLESTASPLKKALIDARIGEDVIGFLADDILFPYMGVIVKNTNIDKKDEFLKIIKDTLKNLVENGLNKDIIDASISKIEFELREAEYGYPKGLAYNIIAMSGWLYDGDAVNNIHFEPILDEIKKEAHNRYFEELIKKYLIDNEHYMFIALIPEKGLLSKKEKELKEKLENIKKSLSPEELKSIIETTKKLKKKQSTPDSPEKLEVIPMLKLDDIDKEPEYIPMKISGNVMINPLNTNGITYINYYFNTKAINDDDIPYINILTSLLSKISTQNYSYEKLSNMINKELGGISFKNEVITQKDREEIYTPYLKVQLKVLDSKIDKVYEIVDEILNKSIFNADRIYDILFETKSRLEISLMNEGHIYAMRRLYSYFSQSGMYSEKLFGISYYKFLVELLSNFDKKKEEVLSKLKMVYECIFNKSNMFLNIVSENKNIENNIKNLINIIQDRLFKFNSYNFNLKKLNEGILAPAQVQYVTKGYNFRKANFEYEGSMNVLKTIIRFDYLWNKIRVLGGAYGAFFNFDTNGNFFLGSYRDPNLESTLKVIDGVSEYLENLNINNREMTKYIIGTIGEMDAYLTPRQKGERAMKYYLNGTNFEELRCVRNKILNTKLEDIKSYTEFFRETLKNNYVCVFGNETKIKNSKGIFDNFVNLFWK